MNGKRFAWYPFGNNVVGTDSGFNTISGNFSFTERLVAKYGGPAAMYFVSKKLKKRHNITDERKALFEAAETWVDTLKSRQYLVIVDLRKRKIQLPYTWDCHMSI
ncbi:prostaglandin E synthase 2 [Tanacetum coccineum]